MHYRHDLNLYQLPDVKDTSVNCKISYMFTVLYFWLFSLIFCQEDKYVSLGSFYLKKKKSLAKISAKLQWIFNAAVNRQSFLAWKTLFASFQKQQLSCCFFFFPCLFFLFFFFLLSSSDLYISFPAQSSKAKDFREDSNALCRFYLLNKEHKAEEALPELVLSGLWT